MTTTTPHSVALPRRTFTILVTCLALLASMTVVFRPVPAHALTTGELAARVFAKVNSYRAAYGRPALKRSPALDRTASAHNAEMAAHNMLTTRVPYELSVSGRIHRVGYASVGAYENVGAAGVSPRVLAQPTLWMGGPVRRAQMLTRLSQYAGVAVRYDSTHHRFWVTMDIGYRPPPLSTTIANAVLSQMNRQRAAHGVPALSMNAQLLLSARRHNRAMAAANTMSHQLPGELGFASRILLAGYNYRTAGENVGWNTVMTLVGAQYLQTLMYNEVPPNDGHRLNILNRTYRHVGIDIYLDSAHHKLWLTEDFGSLM